MDIQMITIEECKKTLLNSGKSYSTKELEKILEFLKDLADISLNEHTKNDGKSNNVHPRIN